MDWQSEYGSDTSSEDNLEEIEAALYSQIHYANDQSLSQTSETTQTKVGVNIDGMQWQTENEQISALNVNNGIHGQNLEDMTALSSAVIDISGGSDSSVKITDFLVKTAGRRSSKLKKKNVKTNESVIVIESDENIVDGNIINIGCSSKTVQGVGKESSDEEILSVGDDESFSELDLDSSELEMSVISDTDMENSSDESNLEESPFEIIDSQEERESGIEEDSVIVIQSGSESSDYSHSEDEDDDLVTLEDKPDDDIQVNIQMIAGANRSTLLDLEDLEEIYKSMGGGYAPF